MKLKDSGPAPNPNLTSVGRRRDAKINGMARALAKLHAALVRIEASMVTKDDFRRMMAVFDAFAAKLETYALKSTTPPHQAAVKVRL